MTWVEEFPWLEWGETRQLLASKRVTIIGVELPFDGRKPYLGVRYSCETFLGRELRYGRLDVDTVYTLVEQETTPLMGEEGRYVRTVSPPRNEMMHRNLVSMCPMLGEAVQEYRETVEDEDVQLPAGRADAVADTVERLEDIREQCLTVEMNDTVNPADYVRP